MITTSLKRLTLPSQYKLKEHDLKNMTKKTHIRLSPLCLIETEPMQKDVPWRPVELKTIIINTKYTQS